MNRGTRLEIEFTQDRRVLLVPDGEARLRLTELLRREQLPLNTRCGQRGLCDGCRVELLDGRLIHVNTGQTLEAGASSAQVRACEYRLAEGHDTRIHVHPRSLLAYEPQVVMDFRTNVPRAHDPLWQQLEIPKTERDGDVGAVIARHRHAQRPVRVAPEIVVPQAGPLFVTTEYHGDHWLVTRVAETSGPPAFGAAVDIGTTTVALVLVELATGKVVSRAADFNRQMHLGDDVLTRINLCATDPSMLGTLQRALVHETIAPLLTQALDAAHAPHDQLVCLTVAANTTMLHLFAGVDPTPMGMAPFTPAFLEHRVLSSPSLFHSPSFSPPPFPIHLLPGASAYVGADLVAGVFASGMIYDESPSLLVDVGTNGEIVLKHGDRLYGCATAAGPAFEGAGLNSGARAGDGAIERIRFTHEPFTVHTKVIGGGKPTGICGSAYIDFLAEARHAGLINAHGRCEKGAGHGHVIESEDHGRALQLARGAHPIVISELDIARLLQAKAAIAAGILTLLHRVGLTPAQVKRLYLAGGFGMHIAVPHAIGCGLLPEFTVEQVQVVGNTSLAGAYLALLDTGVLDEMRRIGQRVEVVELNLDPEFESRYIDQLSLPGP